MLVVLIDDHLMLTESVKNQLVIKEGITEVKTYSSGTAFVQDKNLIPPDVLITDLMMPGNVNGIEVIDFCKKTFKDKTKILVLTSITDVQTIRQTIRNGANGFLSKFSSVDELMEAIQSVLDGQQYIAKNLRDSLLNTVFTEDQVVYHLSPREKEVLRRVCSGCTIKEIAYDLKLSVHTVQYYHRSVLSKLKLKKTSDLIVFAMQNGMYIPSVK